MSKSEAKIQNEVRLYVGQLPDFVIYRNNTGKIMNQGRMVHFGLCKGSADLIGFHVGTGRFIAMELKTVTGRASREQTAFIQLVNRSGGAAQIIRSTEEAELFIARVRKNDFFS